MKYRACIQLSPFSLEDLCENFAVARETTMYQELYPKLAWDLFVCFGGCGFRSSVKAERRSGPLSME